MFKTLKAVRLQKNQLIKDVKCAVVKDRMKGMPEIKGEISEVCYKICPTKAIIDNKIDLGKCIFCGECERECSNIVFKNDYKMGSTDRNALIVPNNLTPKNASDRIKKILGRSLKLRQVSAGGCNACEMELNATGNANFDMGRFGIDFVASPRHADGIVITGPISENMAFALEDCYKSTPNPKVVILCGACAISGGVFQNSEKLNRQFLEKYPIDLYIPGCPVHPLTFINAILDFIS